MAVRRDNMISINAPSSLIMSTFLIRSATSQSSNYPVVLKRLGGPRSRLYPLLKLWMCRESNPRLYLDREYWDKSVAGQIPHDAGLAPIRPAGDAA